MKRLIMAAVFLLFSWQWLFAEQVRITINKKIVYQSEAIKIQAIRKSTAPFSINFLGRKHHSFLMGKYQTVLLGVDYQLKPDTYSLTGVFEASKNFYPPIYYKIRVKEKFPKLKYQPPKRSEEEQQRINKEFKEKFEVISNLSLVLPKMKRFSPPVFLLKVTSEFGVKRCLEKKNKKSFNCRYHLGTDYRGFFGNFRRVKILAINDGRVAFVGNHLVEGNLVVIDHGNGISSESFHLSKVFVKKGELVKRGQAIGIAGESGSARGVHLHLTIKMDNGKTIVDPERFLLLDF